MWSTFNVDVALSGTPTYLRSGAPTASWRSTDYMSQYGNVAGRVVAAGFEVTNTSSDLYKQGTVTVYKQPCQTTRDALCIQDPYNPIVAPYATVHAPAHRYCETLQCPPTSSTDIAKLLQFGGARQWQAGEGSYCVCTQNSLENPLEFGSQVPLVFRLASAGWSDPSVSSVTQGSQYANNVEMVTTGCFYQAANGGWATSSHVENGPLTRTLPFDQSGAYFQGLAPQSTLTLVTRVLLEIAPDLNNTSVISLAKPSPAYDPMALEFLARMAQTEPAGVMVKENGLGDWFEGIASTLASAIPVIGPVASKLAGKGARALGDYISDSRASKNAKEQGLNPHEVVKEKQEKRKAKRKAKKLA